LIRGLTTWAREDLPHVQASAGSKGSRFDAAGLRGNGVRG